MSESFAHWLKKRRKELDLTQEALASRLAVATTTVRKLEAGARRPSRALALALAEALNVPPAQQASFIELARGAAVPAPAGAPATVPSDALYQVPTPLTPLIGREEVVTAICERLHDPGVRLLSLVGPPGIGKTRLSLAVAERLRHDFAHGVVFVRLATITESERVLPAIARALKLPEIAQKPVLEQLTAFVAPREMLLVLDNFEQVFDAGLALGPLLAESPRLKILVTSRVALRLYAEHRFAVPPLPVPELKTLPNLDQLAQVPAVALFVQRALAATGDFALTPTNAAAVAALCVHLDGLPLALELAAARTELYSVQTLLQRLSRHEAGSSLPLLQHSARDVSPRHQTIAAAVAWSYDLLDEDEQRLFRRLAAFSGGFTPSAAAAVCGEDGATRLPSLLEKSLIQTVPRQNRTPSVRDLEPRFSLLQVVREFAQARLQAASDEAKTHHRHFVHYAEFMKMAYDRMEGSETGFWLDRVEEEHDNYRTALTWALAKDAVESAAGLLHRLWWFWHVRGYYGEGRRWLARFLEEPHLARLTTEMQAHLFNGAGVLCWDQGDYAAAQTYLAQSLERQRQVGNRRGIAAVLGNMGIVARRQGNYDFALACQEECLALCRQEEHAWSIAVALNNLGELMRDMGDRVRAATYWEECLALRGAAGDVHGMGTTLLNLGGLAYDAGHYERARDLLTRALANLTEVGVRGPQAKALLQLGDVARRAGNALEALARYREALAICREADDQEAIADSLEAFAALLGEQNEAQQAAVLLGAAEALREALDSHRSPADDEQYDAIVTSVAKQLTAPVFDAAWSRGRGLQQADVLALALSVEARPAQAFASSGAAAAALSQLTPREKEVLQLVAAGLSNADIANRLIISQHTVSAHLRTIYDKLGVHSRSAATRLALEQGLA